MVSNWEPARSLVAGAVSGAEIAPCLPALAAACLSASERRWASQQLLALLWYSLSPLFCEQARLCLRAFRGKVPPLSFSPWLSHSLGCYLALAPSDCPQGIQAQSLPYTGSPRLPVQPLLAGGGSSIWATSPLGVAVRCIFCGFFLFPSQLCCPLRFRNSPQTHQ